MENQRNEHGGNLDRKIYEMYREIDDLLCQGDFEGCNSELKEVDVAGSNLEMLTGYLRITFPAREKLPYWTQLRDEIKERAVADLGPERMLELLRGLV